MSLLYKPACWQVILTIVILAASVPAMSQDLPFARSSLSIETSSGGIDFDVEIADTPELRSQGLMHRNYIPKGTGMLFDFKEIRPVTMWMKNTPSSLDMLFIDENGTIKTIITNTTPFSEEVLPSLVPVLAVLELPAGSVAGLGIAVGDTVHHPVFSVSDNF